MSAQYCCRLVVVVDNVKNSVNWWRQDKTDLSARDGQRNYWTDRQTPCSDAQQQQPEPGTLVAN